MKKPLLILILLTTLINACNPGGNATVEKSVKVWGNCEKCEARIEKAAKIKGVTEADWNIDSKLLRFKFDTLVTSESQILKSVAHAGHDNELFFGDDYAYSALPETCQYERRSE